MKTLIIAEKPSVARDIASVLGRFNNKDGYMENGQYIVSWALGHLVELAEPHDYEQGLKEWSFKKLPIIPEIFKLKPVRGTSAKQLTVLKKLMTSANEIELVINACDAGREGELIFRRIFTWCGCNKPVKRLWLSEATSAAVMKAFGSLRAGRELDNLAAAAEARGKADWLIGINATRAYSVRHNTVLSVGRVQTPTLAMVVARERAIRNFKPEQYWEIWATFQKDNGQTYRGKWFRQEEDRLKQKGAAESAAGAAATTGKVTLVEQKEAREQPPFLFNLNDLQKEANKRYGMTAQKTLDAAQALYEKHKLLTYPRTDSRHLTAALVQETLHDRLGALAAAPEYGALIPKEQPELGRRYVDDTKVTDHHAIIPTTTRPDLAVLDKDERLVYELVARRFLAAFYPDARYAVTRVITTSGSENFISKGRVEIDPGWKVVYSNNAEPENKGEEGENNQVLPPLAQGEVVSVKEIEIPEKQTKAPARFTEATLLAAMENAGRLVEDKEMANVLKEAGGLGTPATRAAIIERLIKVGYIQRQKKNLFPTPKGETLIDLVPEQVKSPEMTASWERGLEEIEQGKDPGRWMEGIISFTKEAVEMAAKQEQNRQVKGGDREVIGKCPLCGREVVEYPKSYGCTGYKDGCKFVIWKEIARKKISKTQAKTLLQKKKTGKIKGFKSKAGKEFEAILQINSDGKVEFSFPEKGVKK